MTKTAVVIPVIQLKFLPECLDSIESAGIPEGTVFCVVNDGNPQLVGKLETLIGNRAWLEVHHLKKNLGFSGANNAGWRHLIEKYPSVKYLGSLNNDTLCKEGWLPPLLDVLERNPLAGIVGPKMQVIDRTCFGLRRFRLLRRVIDKWNLWKLPGMSRLRIYSTWKFGDWDVPMIPDLADIEEDSETELIGGFCVIGRRSLLEAVGMFDEEYRNSCEDVDLSLKTTRAGYKLIVVAKSLVFHHEGASRYKRGTNTNLSLSKEVLRRRWENA